MTGFVGWIGLNGNPESRDAILARMGKAAGSEKVTLVAQGENFAIAVFDGIYPISHASADGVHAVILGRPRWLDSGLEKQAASSSHSATLISVWRDSGSKVLSQLSGSFSLIVTNGVETLAAIDHYGVHALSYATPNGGIVLSSHVSAVAAHPAVGNEIEMQALFNYFHFHTIPSPQTIFKHARKLRPAEAVSVNKTEARAALYFHHCYINENGAPFKSKKEALHHLLEQSVKRNIYGDACAAFLSGGLDSSTVAGYLARLKGGRADTYSIGFEQQGFDEMEYVRIASKHFNLNSHEYYLQPQDIVDSIPIIAKAYDEPFANNSAVPTYLCAKKARLDGFTQLLAGDGGDEIFGGNSRYAKQMLFEHYYLLPLWMRKTLIEPFVNSFPFSHRLAPFRKAQSYLTQANVPLPDRLETYNFLHRQPLTDIFEPDFLSVINPDEPVHSLRAAYFDTDSSHPINRMLHLDMKFTLADNDLRKVMRMSEAAGVEVFFPMLDDDLVSFSCSLPPSDKVKGQQLRWLYKQSLSGFLPDEIINKSKHGFGLPFGPWALSHPPLKEWVNNRLDSFSQRGWVRPSYIQSLRKMHAEVHPVYYGSMIWLLAILEEWLESRNI